MSVYAYDFDGVLHKSVGPPDDQGERHYLFDDVKKYKPVRRILRQIRSQLANNDRVLIISARGRRALEPVRSYLRKHLGKGSEKIECLFTSGGNKTPYLKEYQVNEYYDDSCLRINQLCQEKIPSLRALYMVYPETETWTRVECPSEECLIYPIQRDMEDLFRGGSLDQAGDDQLEGYLQALRVLYRQI